MSPGSPLDRVHAPLQQWAQSRGENVALRSGAFALSFSQLQEQVSAGARALQEAQAPEALMVDASLPIAQRLVAFLSIVASGRCAVVGDPDWPASVRQAVQAALPNNPASMPQPEGSTPFYIGYTSGSTGSPKGYRRNHRSWAESFRACLQAFGPEAGSCVLAPGRDSQSLFLFGMLLGLWSGAGVVLQEHFSANAALDTLRSGLTPCLVAVPSQLLMMLEAARHQNQAPIGTVRLILVSGSRWMRSRTPELRALFPAARIIEFYGASETSFIAWMDTDEHAPAAVVGRPFAQVELRFEAPQAEDAAGLIFVRSPMVFMDYVGGANDATAALRDGDWISVRDLGYLDAQGRLCLVGRQNRMLVTLGKNLFPEEVESVLERHPAIASASVHGLSDALRGLQVVAVLQWAPRLTSKRPDTLALKAWCRQHLEGYKVPRRFFSCEEWPMTASGKTAHAHLGQRLNAYHDGPEATTPASDTAWMCPLP